MVTNKHCCYGTCNSDTRYPDRPEMDGVFFLNFPKQITQPEKCERWVRLCGRPREGFNVNTVTKSTFICSKHFVGGKGPTLEHPDPIPATAYPEQVRKLCRSKRKAPVPRLGKTRIPLKQRRFDAAEALLSLSTLDSPSERGLTESEQRDNISDDSAASTSSLFVTKPVDSDHPHAPVNCRCAGKVQLQDTASQTLYEKYVLQSKVETMILRNEINVLRTKSTVTILPRETVPLLCLDDIKDDNKKMKFFTGLTHLHFMALFRFLGQAVDNLKYWNNSDKGKTQSAKKTTPIDELFITLVRLRRGYCFYTMSFLFKLSESWIRVLFTTWLQFLYCHFNDLRSQMFPDRSVLKEFKPKSFKGFKNVRCSVDCTEFFVQMPRNFARQGNLYSNYKSHHTFKCLIAVAPNGTGVFISDLYEGAISDKEIFEQCGILDHLNPHDLILVDRGFTVKELLMQRQVYMNIPPFLNGREKLTPQEECLTRQIAKARIHVERYNERLKKFRLISGTMPLSLTPLASQAVFVACCLVNFQDQLAK